MVRHESDSNSQPLFEKPLSRRSFLGIAGGIALASTLPSSAKAMPFPWPHEETQGERLEHMRQHIGRGIARDIEMYLRPGEDEDSRTIPTTSELDRYGRKEHGNVGSFNFDIEHNFSHPVPGHEYRPSALMVFSNSTVGEPHGDAVYVAQREAANGQRRRVIVGTSISEDMRQQALGILDDPNTSDFELFAAILNDPVTQFRTSLLYTERSDASSYTYAADSQSGVHPKYLNELTEEYMRFIRL